jgi:surface polysaccharide O-acyltransferase-like enzyme
MKTVNSETVTQISAEKPASAKIAYIDHLKVLAIVLVVLHHTFITYGAPGSWYFKQPSNLMAAKFPMTVFVATNQSFFMGFFFFLSALFVGPSYKKKGAGKFLSDRLKRLGVPLVFYSLVLSPVLNYIAEHFGYGQHHSFIEYMSGYNHWIDFGVMWFVAALIVFNLVYLVIKQLSSNPGLKIDWPSNTQLLIAGVLMGLISFLVRLIWPTGWVLSPVGFQLGYFPQYIICFIAGLIATNNKWLDKLNLRQGKRMAWMARAMVLIALPAIFIWYLKAKFPDNYFSGGWNPIAITYTLWEQITGVMIMVALLCIAKFKWNNDTPFLKALSANAFGVYMFHPLLVISVSLLLKDWAIEPAVKLLVAAPLAVASSFAFAGLLRKIPGVRNFL